MENMSLERLVGIIVEIIGILVGALRYVVILNEVGPMTFILGFVTLVIGFIITVFPEYKREDC